MEISLNFIMPRKRVKEIQKPIYFYFKKNFYRATLFIFLVLLLLFYCGENYFHQVLATIPKLNINSIPNDIGILPAPYPEIKETISPPNLTAESAILIDVPSAVILYQKNPQEELHPASITKMMTALVSLDHFRLNEIVTVSLYEKEGAQMGLSTGDKVSINSLLLGLLINSGNDAASVLANYYPGGTQSFIEEMNRKAVILNLTGTHFNNVTGFSELGHYTTAVDLARLAAYGLKNPLFANIVGTKTSIVYDTTFKKGYVLENVNKLLGVLPGINGVKTGWTEEAGECLVASWDGNGRKLISVILGSKDRFTDTKNILEWGMTNTIWQEVQATHQ